MKRRIFALSGGHSGEHRDVFVREKPPGGAEYWPVDTDPVDRLIVAASPRKDPKVLLLSTASEDGNKDVGLMYEFFVKRFGGYGCRTSILKLIQESPSDTEIKEAIDSADIIYVSGGNSFEALKKWRELGVDRLLRKAYESGAPMSGLSAGAICWFKYGCSNSFYTNKPFRVEGLGWIDGLLCPHYDLEAFHQEPFRQMLKNTPGLVGLALGEYTALEIVNEEKFRLHTYGPGGQAHAVRYLVGDFVYTEIKPSSEYRALGPLLAPNPPE